MVHISNPSPQEAEVKGSCTQGQSGYIVRTCVIHVYVCVCLNWAFRERSTCGGLGERRGSGVWIVSGQELKWKNLVTVTARNDTGIEVLLPCGSVCLVSPSERHASPSRKCLCVIGRTPVFLGGESSLRLTLSVWWLNFPSFRGTKTFLNVGTLVVKIRRGGTRWSSYLDVWDVLQLQGQRRTTAGEWAVIWLMPGYL